MKRPEEMTIKELTHAAMALDPNVSTGAILQLAERCGELYNRGRDAGGRGGLEASDARNRLRRYIETLPEEPRS